MQVMACGTDATDLKMIDGFGYAPDLPFITGHEIAGVVADFGGHVTDFTPGDRVVAHNFFTCGKCLLCRTNREQLCIDMSGVMGARIKHGGHAEYVLVPARQLVAVPEGVPWADAAVCCDAGITAFHAVDRADVSLGETVVVVGVGGVGFRRNPTCKGGWGICHRRRPFGGKGGARSRNGRRCRAQR